MTMSNRSGMVLCTEALERQRRGESAAVLFFFSGCGGSCVLEQGRVRGSWGALLGPLSHCPAGCKSEGGFASKQIRAKVAVTCCCE